MADEHPTNDKILSQDEVDALLNAVNDGAVATETNVPTPEQKDLQKFDFVSYRKIVRPSLPGLKLVYDRFQRYLRQSLSRILRRNVVTDCKVTKMMRNAEYMGKLPIPSCLNVFAMDPLIGNGVISIDAKFIYGFVDMLFGGGKMKVMRKNEGQDFTAIELKIIQKLTSEMLDSLKEAWSQRYDISFQFIRTEQNPEYVQITSADDIVLVTETAIEVEELRGTATIIVPYYSLDPIKSLLLDHTKIEAVMTSTNWRDWIGSNLHRSKIEVSAKFRGTNVSLRDVVSLKKGDVIQLDDYAVEPIPVYVEGVHKFDGRIGVSCGFRAIEVDRARTRDAN